MGLELTWVSIAASLLMAMAGACIFIYLHPDDHPSGARISSIPAVKRGSEEVKFHVFDEGDQPHDR